MRHPSFEGLRDDKSPAQVVLEKEADTKEILQQSTNSSKHKIIPAAPKKLRKTLLNPKEETQVRKINGNDIKFTNLRKIFWPEEKITKRDLINYYYQAAPFILPYLKNRPQSLDRHPNGFKGKSFYQKNVTGKVPAWIETFPYHSSVDGDKNFLVITDEASLLYIVSLGCIEINPWSSTAAKPDNPDWCIIDLDPDKNTFDQVIVAAQVTKTILDAVGVNSYCKTSGSTGLHIYFPLGAKYTYEESKEFARKIATRVNKELPAFTSIERIVNNRSGKMYVDFLQNRPQATLAAPYSVRPKPGATVSMPLHWEEVKKGLKMKDFTLKNAIERMRSEGDIFKPVLGKGINMKAALKKLEAF
jgi:bifunctional non-homologous end joining protein LigD